MFFTEHKRNQVQAFAYDEDIHQLAPFKTSDAFIEFLGVPQNLLQPEPPQSAAHSPFTFDNLVDAGCGCGNFTGPTFASASRLARLNGFERTGL